MTTPQLESDACTVRADARARYCSPGRQAPESTDLYCSDLPWRANYKQYKHRVLIQLYQVHVYEHYNSGTEVVQKWIIRCQVPKSWCVQYWFLTGNVLHRYCVHCTTVQLYVLKCTEMYCTVYSVLYRTEVPEAYCTGTVHRLLYIYCTISSTVP